MMFGVRGGEKITGGFVTGLILQAAPVHEKRLLLNGDTDRSGRRMEWGRPACPPSTTVVSPQPELISNGNLCNFIVLLGAW
jgi:hypothetical protein